MASKPSVFLSSLEWKALLAGGCLFTAGALIGSVVAGRPKKATIIPSPRTTRLPKLSEEEKSQLPYPPDVLPGARDVDTPYGTIKVYEFGPEDGRKVLLVHGISTPAISLGGVAHGLVDHGCRVMLFDLFGRGYSDNPVDLPQDARLFTTQILLALASSPLSWTGKDSGKFSLMGYSLGGGISAAFTSYFPDLVDSLVLVAPAGLIRPAHISRTSRIIYSEGIIPEPILQRLIRRRLRQPLATPANAGDSKGQKGDATEAVHAEVNLESNSQAALSKIRPHVTVEAAVLDQLTVHPGFVPAYVSSMRYGPVRSQHDRWRIIGDRLSRQNQEKGTQKKVLIVCGATDPIIIRWELEEDATEVLSGNVEFVVLDARHDVPITKPDQIVEHLVDFWRRTDFP
ncbi:hypothetical protein A1O1_01223 [Capronia coronata CBS 617.96]|uniref:AB hydrolase-1 domain-containing protein n=1 Tax=Capronia coronata CBS 617.96 TaxID=1182541 RepID=W9YT61_9EURO|nr:uncharacterized protein A1O1_01223 [Capronia coronata CBS 617.96]EXJ96097.1 hypothetical protein A1O1_01223 [Capronia coronata CBS 617.96]